MAKSKATKQKSAKHAPSKKAQKTIHTSVKSAKAAKVVKTKSKTVKSLKAATIPTKGRSSKKVSTKKVEVKKVIPTKAAEKVLKSAKTPVIATKPTKAPKETEAPVKPAAPTKQSDCSIPGCKEPATTNSYCRLHYMMAYQAKILTQKKEAQSKLRDILASLGDKYPDEYMDMIRNDLSSDENFKDAVDDLDLPEDSEMELGSLGK